MRQPMRDLSGFTGSGYDVGRPVAVQAAWLFVQSLIFQHWWCPAALRIAILRWFGAEIADGVLVRHRVRIHWPWKLTVGRGSWIGEGAWILNLEHVHVGQNVVISQEALVCSGSHDRKSPTFEFDNAPIRIGDGAWIATRAIVLRGSVISPGETISAGEVRARGANRP